MRGATLTALVAASLATTSSALYLAERTDALPAVVGLNIQRKHVHNPAQRDLQRRQQVVSETLDNLVSLLQHRILFVLILTCRRGLCTLPTLA